jgi:hypothetical protein
MEHDHPELCNWGDMKFSLLEKIAEQVPKQVVIQFHNNGEPLLFPRLGEALDLFPDNIRCFDTNGILLLHKADEIITKLDTLTISVVPDDSSRDSQYETVTRFLEKKGNRKPVLVYRLLGDIPGRERWYDLPGVVATRVLHAPEGSFRYEKKVTVPEIGVCLDLLHHLVVDRLGNVFPCVRYNPMGLNLLGNLNFDSLYDMWYGFKRDLMIREHLLGNRAISPLCSKCDYWGCPTG